MQLSKVHDYPLNEHTPAQLQAARNSEIPARVRELDDSVAAMQKVWGIPDDALSVIRFALTQVLGTGHVSREELMQITERAPGLLGAIAGIAGHDTSDYRRLCALQDIPAENFFGHFSQAMKIMQESFT